MRRYGCKYGLPHDPKIVRESKSVKIEVCMICNRRFRWNKSLKGRVNNVEYLKVHARAFAQRGGATKQLYMRIYKPEQCVIVI